MMKRTVHTIRIHPSLVNGFFVATCSVATTASLAAAVAPGDGHNAQKAAQALGLTPEALACVGVHGSEPSLVYSRLVEEYSTYEQLQSLQHQQLDQQLIVHEAKSVLRNYADNQDALTARDHAQAEIARIGAQIHTIRNGLIDTVLFELADDSLVDDVITTSGIFISLPPAYRLAVSTVDEAKDLAWALQMRERADANDISLNSSAQQILQQAEAQVGVQTALARSSSYTTANEQSIQQWILAN